MSEHRYWIERRNGFLALMTKGMYGPTCVEEYANTLDAELAAARHLDHAAAMRNALHRWKEEQGE